MSDETKPTAYLHTLDNTEGIEGNTPSLLLRFSPENPFGKPGINYGEEYPWTVDPLYTSDEITRLRADLTKAKHILAAYEVASVQRGADLHAAITRANHAEAALAAVTAERDAAKRSAYEDAARFIEENVFNYGSDDQYWSHRKGGNTDGLEYAREFRARAAIEGVKEPQQSGGANE